MPTAPVPVTSAQGRVAPRRAAERRVYMSASRGGADASWADVWHWFMHRGSDVPPVNVLEYWQLDLARARLPQARVVNSLG